MRSYISFALLACSTLLAPARGLAQNVDGWLWNPVPNTYCGNGSSTGYGWKPAGESRQIAIFFQGGGACRSFLECYVLHTASRVTQGYDAGQFAKETLKLRDFSLTETHGPFGDMHMAWVPYCTGDLHAGHQVYKEFNGRKTYHVGGTNAALDMAHIAAQMSAIDDVWLVGFSAGGFATLLNADNARAAFPQARIHVVDDSGLAYADSSKIPARWGSSPFPSDCEGCSTNFSLLFPYFARKNPGSRFAYISYTRDTVLTLFFRRTTSQFKHDAQAFADSLDGMKLTNLSYFYVPARGHVVSNNPDSISDSVRYIDWIWELVEGRTGWTSERAAPDIDDDVPEISPADGSSSAIDPPHNLPDPADEPTDDPNSLPQDGAYPDDESEPDPSADAP